MSRAVRLLHLYVFVVWTGTISPFWPFVDYRLTLEERHEITVSLEMHALKLSFLKYGESIPVTARSKAWVYGRSLAGIVGSNPAGGMSIVSVVCVVRWRFLRRAGHSSTRDLRNVICLSVIINPR
jgi:hypothetical protein